MRHPKRRYSIREILISLFPDMALYTSVTYICTYGHEVLPRKVPLKIVNFSEVVFF
jgi:hypothetical protein